MDEQHREKWYRYQHGRHGIPVDALRREFAAELAGQVPMDAPLEVPDKLEVFYKYSYGGQSRFFREIRENGKLYGAKCTGCGKVYCPPRAHCSLCYVPTAWVPLPGTGTITAFTVQYVSTSAFIKKTPFICAYVRLDGSDFLLMANMEVDDVARIRVGTRVQAVFRDERHGAITDFYFQPIDAA
jgi:uncharacterized OB-fold protein